MCALTICFSLSVCKQSLDSVPGFLDETISSCFCSANRRWRHKFFCRSIRRVTLFNPFLDKAFTLQVLFSWEIASKGGLASVHFEVFAAYKNEKVWLQGERRVWHRIIKWKTLPMTSYDTISAGKGLIWFVVHICCRLEHTKKFVCPNFKANTGNQPCRELTTKWQYYTFSADLTVRYCALLEKIFFTL